jgi:hypothetical protein
MADIKDLGGKMWIGVVEDNKDPDRLGRVRIRVMDVYDDLPLEAIPWATAYKDANGTAFNIPDVGKVVSVVFESTIYFPEYIYAQHFNPNLQEKLNRLTETDYVSMKSVIFDDTTQMYVNEAEGLKFDYKYNNINIQKDFMAMNLKDNNANLYLGDATANQQAVLGNHWMDWFDKFISNLLGENAGPYLGNYGAPVIPNPAMIQICLEYKAIRETFLSDHVRIVDDNQVNDVNANKDSLRVDIDQIGDDWKSTVTDNTPEKKGQDNKPKDGAQDATVPNEYQPPATDGSSTTGFDETAEPDAEPTSIDANPELQKIVNAMERKNYTVKKRKFEPNIVGIRKKKHKSPVNNTFDETLHYFFTDDSGGWVHRKYTITTVPGVGKAFKSAARKGGAKKLPEVGSGKQSKTGVSVLVPGQYQDFWTIRVHHKSYEALGQIWKPLPTYRQNTTDYYDFTVPISRDAYGINIHRSMPYREGQAIEGTYVDNWSEGCQVFKSRNQFNEFMNYNYKFRDTYKENKFSYTLMLDTDLT